MKKLLVFVLILSTTVITYGQDKLELDWGLKVGLNNSKITANTDEFNSETINNYHVGAFARINFGTVYLQPEAYFSSKSGDIHDVASYNPLHTISSFDYTTFDVPALVGVKLVNAEAANVRLMAGPVFSFATKRGINGEEDVNRLSKEYLRDNFIAWQYGIGADVLFFTFDARIQTSGKSYYESLNFESKKSILLLTLGIKL